MLIGNLQFIVTFAAEFVSLSLLEHSFSNTPRTLSRIYISAFLAICTEDNSFSRDARLVDSWNNHWLFNLC